MAVKPVPDNYPRVTPYLSIDGAAAAIEFYKKAFGATERMRMDAPGGKVGHAEIEIEGGLELQRLEPPLVGRPAPPSRFATCREGCGGTSPGSGR